jgi:hypothetical protein
MVEVDERPVEGRSSSMQLSITEDGEGGSSLFIFKMGLTGAANSTTPVSPPAPVANELSSIRWPCSLGAASLS